MIIVLGLNTCDRYATIHGKRNLENLEKLSLEGFEHRVSI